MAVRLPLGAVAVPVAVLGVVVLGVAVLGVSVLLLVVGSVGGLLLGLVILVPVLA